MQLVDWLIIACVTLLSFISGINHFVHGERKRSNLIIYGVLALVFGNWLLVEGRPWAAAAYCVALASFQFVLAWHARKKPEAK